MDYDEIMEMVISELVERGYHQQRKEDEEMDRLIKGRIELRQQADLCTATLDEQAKRTLEEYYDSIDHINGHQLKYIYLQGAKDCVRLLKSLGVF